MPLESGNPKTGEEQLLAEKLIQAEFKPTDENYAMYLSQLRLVQGKPMDAVKLVDSFLRTAPYLERAGAWSWIAEVYLRAHQDDKAISAFRKAIENFHKGHEQDLSQICSDGTDACLRHALLKLETEKSKKH